MNQCDPAVLAEMKRRELTKPAGHDKRRLLGDLDGVVGDPLNGAGDEDHDHRHSRASM
jgi:hypothetical protein